MKILIVEDELFIAMLLEEALQDEGYEVIGPFSSASQALEKIEEEMPNAAVLDVNIRGGTSFAVADVLEREDRPFLFLTGYGKGEVPDRYNCHRCLTKPVSPRELVAEVAQLFGRNP
jgi:DNA-binding response OmpR family regulator